MVWNLLRIGLAIGAMLVIYVVGAAIVRKFKVPPEADPDPEDLTPVDANFECIVCGARVTMTAAQRDGDLEAPRHCREDMVRLS